jgi:hypothetical protein
VPVRVTITGFLIRVVRGYCYAALLTTVSRGPEDNRHIDVGSRRQVWPEMLLLVMAKRLLFIVKFKMVQVRVAGICHCNRIS